MKYKIHITTDDGELLDTFEIDTDEKHWDSVHNESDIGAGCIEVIMRNERTR